MNVLVTGGAGFIGSCVARHIVKNYQYYNVTVMDKLDNRDNMKNIEIFRNFNFVKGDITNLDFVDHVIKTNNINFIINFATQTHDERGAGNTLNLTHNNVYGTHVLLESAKNNPKLRRFVHVSTNDLHGKYQIDSPHGATKAAAEMMASAYEKSYDLPVVIARGNHIYGPGQNKGNIIPKIITNALKGERTPINDYENSMRSYLYIDDAVDALDFILHKGKKGEIYNIGTNMNKSTKEVAHDIYTLLNLNDNDNFNDHRFYIEDHKMQELGWSQVTSWKNGLLETINHFKKNNIE